MLGSLQLENRYINSIYVGIKAGVCCSVVGTAGFQWMAMLVTGCLIVGSAVFIYAYVARLDKLPPKRCVPRLWRERATG